MAKVFALFPYLDSKGITGQREFRILDLRIESDVQWYIENPVKEISHVLRTHLDQDFYEIILIDLELDILRSLVEHDLGITMIYPAPNMSPEFILSRCEHYIKLPLSAASVSFILRNYTKWQHDIEVLVNHYDSIILHSVRDLNKFPGFLNRHISLSKELDNQRKDYRAVEHRESRRQIKRREKLEFTKVVKNVWNSITRRA